MPNEKDLKNLEQIRQAQDQLKNQILIKEKLECKIHIQSILSKLNKNRLNLDKNNKKFKKNSSKNY